MTNRNRKLFDEIVSQGLYATYSQPVGSRRGAKRWEVADLVGELRGKGRDKKTALDQAWKSFQRCER